jgi:hypothetical protein
VKLIIRTQPEPDHDGLVAMIEDYEGQVPRAGEYIFHPPLDDDGRADLSTHGNNVMSIKSVTWGIIMRPGRASGGVKYFTGRTEPMVEVWV